jgi:hypothetical protein
MGRKPIQKVPRGLSRPSGAPRLTRDGVDLDAKAAEEKRLSEEAQQEKIPGEISPAEVALNAVYAVVRAKDRARLAASELEQVLGGEGTAAEALTKIRKARALLAGAVGMLAVYDEEGSSDDT